MPSISRTENLQVCKKLNFGCFENMKKMFGFSLLANKKNLETGWVQSKLTLFIL